MPNRSSADKSASHRVTLLDVAHDAGVSRATASLVVRNSDLVADKTRQKVLDSIEKLGYVYNRGAARLRTQRSNSIGLVVPDISNPYFAELTIAAEDQLDHSGYVILLANTSDTHHKQSRFLEAVLEHGVDGVLLCPAKETPEEEIERIRRQIPIVQVLRAIPNLNLDYIGPENVHGAQLGVRHLIDHGHEHIAFLGGPLQSSARQERIKGYTSELEQQDLPVNDEWIIASSASRSGGYYAILELLEQPNPPQAAICYNDVVAFGVMLGLQTSGQIPGEDFAVVGFDNIADSASWPPALTTIACEPRVIGEAAVSRLLERIDNPDLEPYRISLPSKLIVRESCGPHD